MKMSTSTRSSMVHQQYHKHPCTPTTSYLKHNTIKLQRISSVKPSLTGVRMSVTTTTLPRLIKKKKNNNNGEEEEEEAIVVGTKWREYQGVRDWEGLLDPLDEGLRREILRYGGFVDAAYKAFDAQDHTRCRFPKRSLLRQCGLTATGYRLTRNLSATSSLRQSCSAWIGFVAVSQDTRVVSRLGRRDIIISLRGTATPLEWLENLRANLTPLDDHCQSDHDDPAMVETGFLSLYTSGDPGTSLRDTVRAEVGRLMRAYEGEKVSVTITGHSLGAALATLAAYDLNDHLDIPHHSMTTVISFGGPRVGNASFRAGLDRRGIKVLRIVNSDDLVPKLPGFPVFSSKASHTPWVYAEVGEELRLTSRDPQNGFGFGFGFDLATCHDLRTYLHLVENFVSSKCPFRATARQLLQTH